MRITAISIVFLVCFASIGFAAEDKRESECEKTNDKIRKIQAKMRHGYSAAQGVKLNAKLRELRVHRSKVCR